MADDIRSVLLLGFGFMFLFTAFQTSTVIEASVLSSSFGDKKGENIGFTSVAIIYAVFTLANWVAPSIVALFGAKWTLPLTGLAYVAFIAAIIHPIEILIYILAAVLGLCAGALWTAQGQYLTMSSSEETMGRNSGIFWAQLQASLVIGNTFVFFYLRGQDNITLTNRYIIYGCLTGCAVFGVFLLLFLRKKFESTSEDVQFSFSISKDKSPNEKTSSALAAFKTAVRLMGTKEMMCISIAAFYTGLELTFFSGVYDTAVGNINTTVKFGPSFNKKYVPFTGLWIGVGEILSGLLFGILGKKVVRYGRDPVVVIGLLCHLLAFYFVFASVPSNAPYEVADNFHKTPYSLPLGPNLYVAMAAAFLLGFGDGCFNTQIYSIIGGLYQEDSAPPFALYKFSQSAAAAISFFYSPYLDLQYQLAILSVFAVIGAGCFIHVEWKTKRYAGYKAIQ